MKLYVVYDKESKTWSTPFFQPTDIHARRVFATEVAREDAGNMINKYPEHFSLHELGEFNEQEGELTLLKRKLLLQAKALVPTRSEK